MVVLKTCTFLYKRKCVKQCSLKNLDFLNKPNNIGQRSIFHTLFKPFKVFLKSEYFFLNTSVQISYKGFYLSRFYFKNNSIVATLVIAVVTSHSSIICSCCRNYMKKWKVEQKMKPSQLESQKKHTQNTMVFLNGIHILLNETMPQFFRYVSTITYSFIKTIL